jgi:hypothetical protein
MVAFGKKQDIMTPGAATTTRTTTEETPLEMRRPA